MFRRDNNGRSLRRGVDGGGSVRASTICAVSDAGASGDGRISVFPDGIGGSGDRNRVGAIVTNGPTSHYTIMVRYGQDMDVPAVGIRSVLLPAVRSIIDSHWHGGPTGVEEGRRAPSRGRRVSAGIPRRLGHSKQYPQVEGMSSLQVVWVGVVTKGRREVADRGSLGGTRESRRGPREVTDGRMRAHREWE